MAGADTSCSVRTDGGKGDDILKTVARIGGKLASEEGGKLASEEGGEAVLVELLRELEGVHMTFEALEATKIGRAVNALRKSAPSEQARRLAAALYGAWKALADERFRSSRTQQPPPPPKADTGIKKRSPSSSSPPPVDAKQSVGHEGCNREMAPTSVVVDAAPGTKLHLHKVFDSAAIVNTNATGKAELRRVTVVRRTAAAPDPAPASNTRQNGGGSKQKAYCSATASHQGTNAAKRISPTSRTAAAPDPAPASNTRQNGGGSKQQACRPATAIHRGTNAAAKRVSPTNAAPLTTAKPPPALPAKPINGSSGACKRKAEPSTVFDEARLAKARKRLHEGYKEISAAKEKRKIKEIKVIAAQGKAGQRPALSVRCAPAHGTGKQAPAMPCPPRMPRAAF